MIYRSDSLSGQRPPHTLPRSSIIRAGGGLSPVRSTLVLDSLKARLEAASPALGNAAPILRQVPDELDSYMYQTVGHQAVGLYAEAMDVPLYRRTIEGSSLHTAREYSQTEGEEVEDLYQLLKLVKEKERVEAVSVGAILSDYQRVRVENVCVRLQLQPLAYLWRRDQAELLREIISSGLHAVVIKVAAYGLDPDRHLGKSLAEMEAYLHEVRGAPTLLSENKYGVHICGERSEYETFTVDCPLFKKKIVIDSMETIIHSADAFAPVGYLRFTRMHTEDKREGSGGRPLPLSRCPCQNAIDSMTEELEYADKTPDVQGGCPSSAERSCQSEPGCLPSHSSRSSSGYQWISGLTALQSEHPDVQSQTRHVFTLLQRQLQENGLLMKHVLLVHLYVSEMENFSLINSVYCTYFTHNPPARVCVQVWLPVSQQLRMDVLLHDGTVVYEEDAFPQRGTLHVQSLSDWAPANIGPYSQAVQVRAAVFCAGQIALVPCSMQLVKGPVALLQSHGEGSAMDSRLTLAHVLQAHIYITHREHTAAVTETWDTKLQDVQVESSVAVVPSLPRGAAVELHVTAVLDRPTDRASHLSVSQIPACSVECRLLQSSCARYTSLSLSVCLSDPHAAAESITDQLLSSYRSALLKTAGLSALCARVFYKSHDSLVTQIATGLERRWSGGVGRSGPAVALVPVEDLPDLCVLRFSCWLSV
ncbi:diphthine--ammonia ligase-like [Sinocyclocheilus rhinocerous]|uniref:diphthine--ammonia ligase-like n=1 Tax=Sinocyclocheilus rhinocerous TaxID=307959 RepID=UPI0007BA6C88|nr:PREDICTED: diphthine--ammonia ligase-like [Sinocyclocheilus rhinocerous]